MLKVALVGVGGISGCHIPTWESMEETELVALCDVRPERFEPYEGKRCYTDFDEMLEKEEIDILDICLPSYMHPEFSIKAMNKGINVLCEKPISLKKEDVAPIYEAAKRNNVKFMVAHVLRFWPEFDYVKQVVKSGKYGKVMSGFVQRLNHMPRTSWDGWMFDEKRSGFVPFDLHIHDLDFLVYTFGEPKDFSCKRVKTADSDYVNVMYDYGDFFIGGEASWYQQMSPFKAGFRFQFEKALLELENGVLTVYETENDNIFKPFDCTQSNEEGGYIIQSDAYGNEIKYFTKCVLENKEPDIIKPSELEKVIDILNNLF